MESDSGSRLSSFLENPKKALWTLAVPIMFGMGIHTLYNIVDMLFIGRLGGDAIAGVAFNMPIFFLILGLTMGLGYGVTASVAWYIGQNAKIKADHCAEHSFQKYLQVCLFLLYAHKRGLVQFYLPALELLLKGHQGPEPSHW